MTGNWIDGRWMAYDVETSGVAVEHDRIVTACVGRANSSTGSWSAQTWMADPGSIEIPEAATAVHGITTEQARNEGRDAAEVIDEIDRALQAGWALGVPVVGFNVIFDLTILDRELRRHWGRPLNVNGPVIDALVLDKQCDRFRKGSRKLTAVAEHYGCGFDDAHDATADARAALRVAFVIIRRTMPDVALAELHTAQIGWYREQRESFNAYLAKNGETPDSTNTTWPVADWAGEERAVA